MHERLIINVIIKRFKFKKGKNTEGGIFRIRIDRILKDFKDLDVFTP
jgi:hypothetical protein